MNDFSYESYSSMINALKSTLPLKDYAEINGTEECFFLLRHDVEFSVEKAYDLAKIEHEILGIHSSYLFQIRNYTYNPFSFKNRQLIREMSDMGHKIGLHVNTSGLANWDNIKIFIQKEIDLLQNGLELPIDRFSYHRPHHNLLKLKINLAGLINTYDDKYFHFYEENQPQRLNVYYLSDSEHQWKYGKPNDLLAKSIKKLQLLIHPYSWSQNGLTNSANFQELIKSKYKMMLEAMNSECRNFPQELFNHEKI